MFNLKQLTERFFEEVEFCQQELPRVNALLDQATDPNASAFDRQNALNQLIGDGYISVGNLDAKPTGNFLTDIEQAFR
ncbi:MAG TPA: hypothetical protein V6C85_39100 [Allocoleopsis sp.]